MGYSLAMEYRPRVVDAQLAGALRRAGAVLIEGAKGCGKTSTAMQAARSIARIDVDPAVELYMMSDPGLVLAGDQPRLIDEWQRQPKLWDMIRRAVDDQPGPGHFILTGSATPDPTVHRHSGAGRFAVLRMRPMTLFESGVSTGTVSLHGLIESNHVAPEPPVLAELRDWAEIIARGGWPAVCRVDVADAQDYCRDYLALIAEADMAMETGVTRDPIRVVRLIRSLARNVSTEASITTLAKDSAGSTGPLNRETVSRYLDALERLMVVEPQPAWDTALRGSAMLRRAPAWHFVDPSLAVAALGGTPEKLIAEPKTLGLLFESLAIRDLRAYAAADRGEVYRARDSTGKEVDAIIEYPDGWVACEIKLGFGQIEDAALSLNAFVPTVDTQTVGPCKARLVITGTGPSFSRPDGVLVVSLAALTP
jgi:predicted AAA+ superfamily ATPase